MRLFVYLSEILGRKVLDADNQLIGRLYDLSMRLNEEVFPRADSIVVVRGLFNKEYAQIPLDKFQDLGNPLRVILNKSSVNFQSDKIQVEFSLRMDILDQQVVDTDDQKVVRVNDVHILRIDNQFYLAHVDVGIRGLIRRLEWNKFVDTVVKLFSPKAAFLEHEELISWKNAQVLRMGRNRNFLKSDMARKKLAKIPSAELADIMEDLDIFEKVSLFKTFGEEMQRRVFADMVLQEKEELIDQLDDREAGNLLENIPADEATDLLHYLHKDRRTQLMRFMHSKTSKELRKLLGFAQDSAGGLMTTEYLSLGNDALVRDAIQKIKDNTDYPGNIIFIYILDEINRLMGVTSLRRFINEDPERPLIETCYDKEIFVRTDDDVEQVALLLEKYKFSSIPVLNEKDVLQGVITSDDVMEELISLAWTKYKDQL